MMLNKMYYINVHIIIIGIFFDVASEHHLPLAGDNPAKI